MASSESTGNPSSEQHAKITGILVKPKFRKPNKCKVLLGIIGVVVVAIIAVAASFFLCGGKHNSPDVSSVDSIKVKHTKDQSRNKEVKENPKDSISSKDNF